MNEKVKVIFVIKTYLPNEEFINGGCMGKVLDNVKVGDKMKMEGPKGLLSYQGNGNFLIRK